MGETRSSGSGRGCALQGGEKARRHRVVQADLILLIDDDHPLLHPLDDKGVELGEAGQVARPLVVDRLAGGGAGGG